jgi:hypothetical protein
MGKNRNLDSADFNSILLSGCGGSKQVKNRRKHKITDDRVLKSQMRAKLIKN